MKDTEREYEIEETIKAEIKEVIRQVKEVMDEYVEGSNRELAKSLGMMKSINLEERIKEIAREELAKAGIMQKRSTTHQATIYVYKQELSEMMTGIRRRENQIHLEYRQELGITDELTESQKRDIEALVKGDVESNRLKKLDELRDKTIQLDKAYKLMGTKEQIDKVRFMEINDKRKEKCQERNKEIQKEKKKNSWKKNKIKDKKKKKKEKQNK